MDPRSLPHETLALSADEQDLRWYFATDSEPSLIASAWEVMVRRKLLKRSERTKRVRFSCDDLALDRRERTARLATILAATPPEDVRVLRSSLGPDRPPQVEAFGRFGALALASSALARAHRRSKSTAPLETWFSHQRLLHGRDPSLRELLERVNREARTRHTQALNAYREGKRRTGLTGRPDVALRHGSGGRHE
jgi:hypothetical protein